MSKEFNGAMITRARSKEGMDTTVLKYVSECLEEGINPLSHTLACSNGSITVGKKEMFQYFSEVPSTFTLTFEGGYKNVE